ncbi:MAG: DUF349 domain-containing protein [Tangfeifania sp.]
MEPKDLKNPEGLKSTAQDDDSKKDETVKKEENNLENSSGKNENQEKLPDEKPQDEKKEDVSEEKPDVEKDKAQTELSTNENPKDADEPAELSDKPDIEEPEVKKEVTATEAEPEKKAKPEAEEKSPELPGKKEKGKTTASSEEEETEEPEKLKETGISADKKTTDAPAAKEEISKKQDKTSKPSKDKPDYNQFSQVELVNAMRDLLENNDYYHIRDEIEAIKAAFYKQVKDGNEEKKKEFIESGGSEEDFQPEENPYEQDIKNLLKKYRHLRAELGKKLEQEKEENLQVKYDIIEDIKGLINKEESINKTFQEFRDLQQRWRETGLVPQAKMKDLWDTYHFHVENFYDYIKINKELRDLDLKKNLEMKIRLCEQAEELLLEPNIIRAFNALQKLHERWREIGPVPRENKDDIWDRFKVSTAKINKKHQEYYEDRKTEQRKNLEAKRALCEQVEEITELDLNTHKEWGEKSKEVVNLQKVWRTIGFAPRKDNNKIYDRFRKACDTFFDAKREFYAKNKELQQNNLQMKIDLCMQAEALKDSTDWRKTTQDLINIQKQWKETGPVPRKQSEAIWKRFRAACDHFFNKKSEHFSNIDSEQVENLKLKEQLINDVQNFTPTDDAGLNLKALKDFQRRWTEIGHVPIKKKDVVQKNFREAINRLFDDLNLDESKRNLLKFRTKMASFSESSRGQDKMRFERDKYMNKLKQLENDLVLLDNNVGFFAKSKNAESLIEDVKRKIEQTKENIETLKEKIRVIDEMDQSEE